ncbi:MAG: histidine kinase [Aeromicrobium sp.]
MRELFSMPVRLRPSLVDLAIACLFVALVVVEAFTSTVIASPIRYLAIAVPAMALLAWRRAFPLLVITIVLVVRPIIDPNGELSVSLTFGLLAYTVGRECEALRARIGLAIAVAGFLVGLRLADGGLTPSDVAAVGILVGGTWTVGQIVRHRSDQADQARARADRIEREQAVREVAAAAEERIRLARELHDIVSHSISVISVQAQAVRRRLGDGQQRSVDDLIAIENTAREAMAELRRLFGVLRSEGQATPLAPQPGLAELDRLADGLRASGLDVDLTRSGPWTSLPAGLDLAAFRIVQEATTNVLKHAEASAVSVRIDHSEVQLVVVVEDDGRGMNGSAGTGHGLIGIRERAALYGGVLKVSPSTTGGVRVAATIPVVTS